MEQQPARQADRMRQYADSVIVSIDANYFVQCRRSYVLVLLLLLKSHRHCEAIPCGSKITWELLLPITLANVIDRLSKFFHRRTQN